MLLKFHIYDIYTQIFENAFFKNSLYLGDRKVVFNENKSFPISMNDFILSLEGFKSLLIQ